MSWFLFRVSRASIHYLEHPGIKEVSHFSGCVSISSLMLFYSYFMHNSYILTDGLGL